MTDLLTYIVSHLVDNSDKIHIEEKGDGESSNTYFIEVAREDMGKVIGKEGKIIRAIRNLAKIWAVKQNRHVSVELVEAPLKAE